MLNLRLVQPQSLLEVRQLAAMRATNLLQGRLRIGAAVTHAEIEDGVLPDTTQGMLRYVARNIAYRAIRNRGTLGGSLAHCDPAADWVNALTALGAQVILQNAKQERRLPMPEFVRGPFHTALQSDEMLLAVELPAFTSALRWGYYKICAKVGEFADAIGVVVSETSSDTPIAIAVETMKASRHLTSAAPDAARNIDSPDASSRPRLSIVSPNSNRDPSTGIAARRGQGG
jgi:carbon-monoxide dehydrogenase medium subunit